MKLYEINREIEAILNSVVDQETGEIEIGETTAITLDGLQIDRNEKILGIAAFIRGIEAEAAAVEQEERKLRSRKQALENRSRWLRDYLTSNLEEGEKIKDARVSIFWRTSNSVQFTSLDELPDRYWIVERNPSRSMIADAIKSGVDVPGAMLEERKSLVIR